MLKRKNDRQPQRLEEERYPNDYWLDEEDGGDDIPDPAVSSKPVSGRLHSEPMVTGYEALERQRGIRRPNRKLTRREKKALKRAQKYEAKLHKEHEKADKKNAKKEAKLAAKAEKQAMREAKKNAKKKKSSSATAPPRQQPEGKKVSGGKGGTTEKKVENTAKDKRITAQQSIPYHEMGRDGICRVQDRFYSKTIRFYDINYQLAQNEDKNAIFENWCDFLNYFDSTIHFQLSFINQHSNMAEYEKVIHINPQEDEFDDLRMEFAQMLNNQLAKGNNGLMRTKYITFGIEAESIREARPKLERIESDIMNLKSAVMTAEWENQLLMMEKGQITDTQFMGEITSLVRKILEVCREIPEEERRRFQTAREVIGKCPVCGCDVFEGKQNFYCSNRQCDFALWKENRFLGSMEKNLDKKMARELLDKACTHVKGLYSKKKDMKFDADLLLTLEDGKPRFHLEFPKKKKK